jgi:TolA-binding protein
MPPVDRQSTSGLLNEATDWMDAGSYHVARQKLAEILRRSSFTEQNRDVLYWLVQSTFKDQEYEEAYQWASEFVQEYPNDVRRVTVLYIQGVSAYQTHRLDASASALGKFLKEGGDHPQRGAGCFWHAMAELDRGDTAAAQDDIQQCYGDPSALAYRDYILMGWALSLERRGNLDGAAERLERLLSDYPRSELVTDAQLRLASISLRQGRLARTLNMLEQASPSYSSQRQEYLLLEAEANIQLARYQAARDAYEEFASRFSDSPHARKARYGLGWSLVKLGDYARAQAVFDSLGRGHDSLAFASLYQSGILSLLRGRITAALTTLDTLTSLSPYDRDAVSAYFQMGMIQYRGKQYREARRNFQLAARLFPESELRTAAYHMLGESNMAIGDFSNAQYAFAQVRHLGAPPEILAPSLFQEGVALYHLGRFKTCGERFDEYLQKFPRDARAGEGHVWRAEALYQDSRFADAERSYSEALRLYPNNPKKPEAAYGYAWTLFEQKKFSQAASAFDSFTKSYPNDGHYLDAMLRKADSYFAVGEYEKSASLYSTLGAEKASGRQVEYAAFQLAMSYIQRGESDRGVEQLRSFLVKYPSSIYAEVVQFNIGWTYFSREQYALAVTELKTVLRKYGDSQLLPRVLFNLGDSYYNLKEYHSAFFTCVLYDLTQWLLQGTTDDIHANLLIWITVFVTLSRFLECLGCTNQSHATARNNSFLNGCAGSVHCILNTSFLLFHLGFGCGANLNYSNASDEFRQTLLKFLTIVVGSSLVDLSTKCFDATFDVGLFAGTFDDRGVVFVDGDLLGATEIFDLNVLEFDAEIFADHFAARQNCDVLEHCFTTITEPWRFYGCDVQGAAQFVNNESCERLTLDIFSDDEHRLAHLCNLLEQRQEVLH